MLGAGSVLFRHRGWTPVPLLAGQWFYGTRAQLALGLVVLTVGEAIRLWAVGHIGARSRTRTDAVGSLVETGPFGLCRNPLYVGNALILLGVGCWSGPPWAAAWLLFAVLQYAAVVRWEESILLQNHGEDFEAYCRRVPRWLPKGLTRNPGRANWLGAVRSERPTLTAIACVTALFWAPFFDV